MITPFLELFMNETVGNIEALCGEKTLLTLSSHHNIDITDIMVGPIVYLDIITFLDSGESFNTTITMSPELAITFGILMTQDNFRKRKILI